MIKCYVCEGKGKHQDDIGTWYPCCFCGGKGEVSLWHILKDKFWCWFYETRLGEKWLDRSCKKWAERQLAKGGN